MNKDYQTTLPYSRGSVVFRCQRSWWSSNEVDPNEDAKYTWGSKNFRLSTNNSLRPKKRHKRSRDPETPGLGVTCRTYASTHNDQSACQIILKLLFFFCYRCMVNQIWNAQLHLCFEDMMRARNLKNGKRDPDDANFWVVFNPKTNTCNLIWPTYV